MKKLFVSLFVALCATATFAQSSLLATLSHEGNITSFNGSNALKEAYAAAVNGDVITLSSGLFLATDISKAITVRGAGMDADTVTNRQPTVISGDFIISNPTDSTDHHLILEGLYHNNSTLKYKKLTGAQIIKCRLNEVTYYNTTYTNSSISFLQCRIAESLDNYNSSFSLLNTIVEDHYSYGTATTEFNNCFVNYRDKAPISTKNSSFTNCFIKSSSTSSTYYLQSSCVAFNCVALNAYASFFKNMTNSSNKVVSDTNMFKSYSATTADDATYELTDEAKNTYIGNDGKEIGIYGGMLPYETTPNNPQITKFNVASKSTADGKLSVDIQVGIPE